MSIFPFQIHVVHYNTKYDSFREAMVHPDGLAVLGAFLGVSAMDQQGRMGLGWVELDTVLGTGRGAYVL